MQLKPIDFAMSYITRSGRVDLERLRKLSPRFVERYERERGYQSMTRGNRLIQIKTLNNFGDCSFARGIAVARSLHDAHDQAEIRYVETLLLGSPAMRTEEDNDRGENTP